MSKHQTILAVCVLLLLVVLVALQISIRSQINATRKLESGTQLVLRKIDQTVSTWADCGAALRLRVNDRDGDGSGTCRSCFFGSDVLLAPEHFAFPHQYEVFTVEMSIGPERDGHLIEFVAIRGTCDIATVCIDQLTIQG